MIFFPIVGNKKKIRIIIIMKKKMVQIWKGYCPNRIVGNRKIVLQGLHCIAIEKTGLENFVLQYTSFYCRLGG